MFYMNIIEQGELRKLEVKKATVGLGVESKDPKICTVLLPRLALVLITYSTDTQATECVCMCVCVCVCLCACVGHAARNSLGTDFTVKIMKIHYTVRYLFLL
jgi:hypothetical protein